MVQQLRPPEIGAPGTPGVSQETTIFGPNFFSYYPLMMLFYGFCGLVIQKMQKIGKNRSFSAHLFINTRFVKIDLFLIMIGFRAIILPLPGKLLISDQF